jgi:hypothetical protein
MKYEKRNCAIFDFTHAPIQTHTHIYTHTHTHTHVEDKYRTAVQNHVDGWETESAIKKTKRGLSFVSQWGSLRVAGT